MTTIAFATAIFLLFTIGLGLIRVFRGPTTGDRLLSVQLFGTTGAAIVVVLSVSEGNKAFLDIGLIFALLAGILGVVFTRYWLSEEEETSAPASSSNEIVEES